MDTVDWGQAPHDTTHVNLASGIWFKPGPNRHARMWSHYRGAPAWIAATAVRNSDLANPQVFRQRPPQPYSPPTSPLEKGIAAMTDEQVKSLALDNRPMKVVTVTFGGSNKEYHFFAPADAKNGDYAVVYSNDNILREGGYPFTVVKITNDEVIDSGRATKAILATFNEDFAKHVQARMEHLARIKAKLQAKKKAFEEHAFFDMLAKSDPEAAQLLGELKSFGL